MRLIETFIHQDSSALNGRAYERRTARGILLNGEMILLIYTKRYNDYGFPGGGLELDEDVIDGLKREMAEEAGAKLLEVEREFGYTEEYRPYQRDGYDFMLSYFYVCRLTGPLTEAQPEAYEIANGSIPVWVNIHEAIAHNRAVMENEEQSMGFSIRRETAVLELVAKELL